MAKESVLTIKLETELRDAFMAEAQAVHRPASQLIRDFMWAFVEQRREPNPNRAAHYVRSDATVKVGTANQGRAPEIEKESEKNIKEGQATDSAKSSLVPPPPPQPIQTVVTDSPQFLIERILGRR
jgi:hypothetical protein